MPVYLLCTFMYVYRAEIVPDFMQQRTLLQGRISRRTKVPFVASNSVSVNDP